MVWEICACKYAWYCDHHLLTIDLFVYWWGIIMWMSFTNIVLINFC